MDRKKYSMNWRLIEKLFKGSTGSQLSKIIVASLVFLFICILFSKNDPHTIVSLFIDTGAFDENSSWPQLVLALVGFVLFSVLLSSIITAWFTNLNSDIYGGRRRYKLSNHVIIFGGGDQLAGILDSLDRGTDVLVVSNTRPSVKQDNFIYYKGERDDKSIVECTFPAKASVIYIIGEDNEPGHDSRSLKCLDLLKTATDGSGNPIHCFITFDDEETVEVFQYLKGDAGNLSSKLFLVDAINEYEYRAEQFVLNTDYIPVIKKDSSKKAHFILYGAGKMTQAMAYTLAHACHYPKLDGKVRKTRITVIAPDALEMRDNLLLARPHLFNESVYESITSDGNVLVHTPQRDILDIEWRFVQGTMADNHVSSLMRSWVDDDSLENRIAVCDMKSSDAVRNVLHLPFFVYGEIPVAVYLEDSAELINNANETMMYGGHISVFGPASGILSDPLLKHRSECGQRVNFVYAKAKALSRDGELPDSPEKAWYPICEADKLSSIYCGIGLVFREKIFNVDTDIEDVNEAEHRRWMMSEFLMGFRYGSQRDKVLFTHDDLIPYETLPKDEQKKDKILIDNRHYILTGEGEPVISHDK